MITAAQQKCSSNLTTSGTTSASTTFSPRAQGISYKDPSYILGMINRIWTGLVYTFRTTCRFLSGGIFWKNPPIIPQQPSIPITAPSVTTTPSVREITRPMPTSCIPQIATVELQETPADVRRIWPVDLTLLGLTESQKMEVDKCIKEAFRAGEVSCDKKRLIYTNENGSCTVTTPISIYSSEGRIFLLSKVVFASGGERKIRWVYDLTTGNFLLKKRITGPFEEKFLTLMISRRIQRGINTTVYWRNARGKQGKKRQIIEPVRDGTLAQLFGTAPLADFSVKRDLILDLLMDLSVLHTVGLGIPNPSGNKSEPKLSYKAFHADIKPLNILTLFQNGRWRAELCDFGSATANPYAFIISTGFTPPEYIRFFQHKCPLGIKKSYVDSNKFETATFNIQHAIGRDVWALALVILSLLVERQIDVQWRNMKEKRIRNTTISPLPCLQSILSGDISEYYDEAGILNLQQETLNSDLDLLQQEVIHKHNKAEMEISKIFAMLKGMLRINSHERTSIAGCLALLK